MRGKTSRVQFCYTLPHNEISSDVVLSTKARDQVEACRGRQGDMVVRWGLSFTTNPFFDLLLMPLPPPPSPNPNHVLFSLTFHNQLLGPVCCSLTPLTCSSRCCNRDLMIVGLYMFSAICSSIDTIADILGANKEKRMVVANIFLCLFFFLAFFLSAVEFSLTSSSPLHLRPPLKTVWTKLLAHRNLTGTPQPSHETTT